MTNLFTVACLVSITITIIIIIISRSTYSVNAKYVQLTLALHIVAMFIILEL